MTDSLDKLLSRIDRLSNPLDPTRASPPSMSPRTPSTSSRPDPTDSYFSNTGTTSHGGGEGGGRGSTSRTPSTRSKISRYSTQSSLPPSPAQSQYAPYPTSPNSNRLQPRSARSERSNREDLDSLNEALMSGPPSGTGFGEDVFSSPGGSSREVVYSLKELRGIKSNEKDKEKEYKGKHRASKLFPFPLPSLHSSHHSKSLHSEDQIDRTGERSSNSFEHEESTSATSSTNGLRRSYSGKSSGRKSTDLSRSGSNESDRDRMTGRPISLLNQSPVRRNMTPNSIAGSEQRSNISRPISLRSATSSTHSTRTTSHLEAPYIIDPPSFTSKPPSGGSIAGGTRRERRPEAREWNQTCFIWTKEKSKDHVNGSSSSSHGGGGGVLGGLGSGLFSKSKSSSSASVSSPSKRESAILGFGGGGGSASVDFTQNPSEEKKSGPAMEKGSYAVGPSSTTKEGSWKLVTGVLKDDGYLRIFGDEKKAVIHSIYLPSTPRTSISRVDYSLFGRPHCLVLRRSHTTTNSTSSTTSSPHKYFSTSNTSSRPITEEPIYLCLPSMVAMQTWLVMLLCFARPEFLASPLANLPSPLSTSTRPSLPTAGSYDDERDEELVQRNPGKASSSDDEKVEARCRIYRSITIAINEGRGIGELGTEIIRSAPQTSNPNSNADRSSSQPSSASIERGPSKSHSHSISAIPNSRVQPRGTGVGTSLRDHETGATGIDTYCEISVEGEVLSRTSVRKGTVSPFWNERFVFGDLPEFMHPLTISIYQTHKSSKPTLLGVGIVRIPDLPRFEVIEDWWCIKPVSNDFKGKATDTLGEVSLSIRIDEEIVLPRGEYQPLVDLLDDDIDAELAIDIAHEFPTDLEEVTKILLRVYHAQNLLLPRILRLAELEIDGDTKSSAILFRGNSILTKSVELYLRLIGTEYLEASIGSTISRLCEAKVEIEIDPSRMKVGTKEKELAQNVKELREWTEAIWQEIYNAREKCPNEIRQIFQHIQKIVTEKYGQDQKNMRSTSVSAFIFLRFFVPAVLNPKLFSLISTPLDPKTQRTLTLIAKTLQGLANFSCFGEKEIWMEPMRSVVTDNSSAFVDFIQHISTPLASAPFEWTSANSASYLAPNRLRSALTSSAKEGIPLLPHLIDLPRSLGLLASLIVSKGSPVDKNQTSSQIVEGRGRGSASISSSRGGGRSARYTDFTERCGDVYEEARRRGGMGMGSNPFLSKLDSKSKARSATVRSSSSTRSTFGPTSPTGRPVTPDRKSSGLVGGLESPPSSVASRKSHRSFKIQGGIFEKELFEELAASRGDTVEKV